jgi:hypothetical protein
VKQRKHPVLLPAAEAAKTEEVIPPPVSTPFPADFCEKTTWSAGGNGEHLLAAWKDRDGREKPSAKTQETARGIAAAIEAGLQELDR